MFKRIFPVATLLTLLTVTPAMITTAQPAGTQVKQERMDKKSGREQHPHIRAAIHELQEARHELETAAHDFGGHRKEAIEAIDNALRQLQQALQYDKQ